MLDTPCKFLLEQLFGNDGEKGHYAQNILVETPVETYRERRDFYSLLHRSQ